MFLNGCGVFPFASYIHGLTWCSSPLKQAITVFSLSFSCGFPMFLSSPPSPHPFTTFVHSPFTLAFTIFFLSSFLSTKKTLSLHSPLPMKHDKLSQHCVHWKGKWEYREECYRALEMLFCFRFLRCAVDVGVEQPLMSCLGWIACPGMRRNMSSLTASAVPRDREDITSLFSWDSSLRLHSRAQTC